MDLIAYALSSAIYHNFNRAYLPTPEHKIVLAAMGGKSLFRRAHGGLEDIGPDVEPPPVENPSADSGAILPISYTLGDICSGSCSAKYVDTGGGGSTCSQGSPCATLTAAISAADGVDDIIVVNAGTYTNAGNTWNGSAWTSELSFSKSVKLYAADDATVTFDGSTNLFAASWTTEGSYKYAAYTPRPCANNAGSNAFGITFCTESGVDNMNGTDTVSPYNVGKWNDALWIDGIQVKQVVRKADLVAGTPAVGAATPTFWVDRTQTIPGTASVANNSRNITGVGTNFTVLLQVGDSITLGGQTKIIDQITSNTVARVSVNFSPAVTSQTMTRNGNNRIYLVGSVKDAAASEIAVCNLGDFAAVSADDVEWHGITVKRYCNQQQRAAVVDLTAAADRFRLDNVVFDQNTAMNLFLQGSASDPLEDVTLNHVTLSDTNWVGMNPLYTDTLTVNKTRMTGTDRWDEIASSPQSGAFKSSRAVRTIISNSYIANNRSQGIWFDQSNWGPTHIFNSTIENTGLSGEGSSVFYEISHGLRFYNNIVRSPLAVALKITASNDVQIINNTLIGGADVLGIYADTRSRLNCATTLTGNDLGGVSCGPFIASDQWRGVAPWDAAPVDMNWLTVVNIIQGNIIAYPTGIGLCNSLITIVCIARINSPATLSLNAMIPDGVVWNCNVYATTDAAGRYFIHTNPTTSAFISYTSVASWASAIAGASPYPAETVDAASLSGTQYVQSNGTPTPTLDGLHASSACGFPTDATMNATIAAGTKRYGVTYLDPS